MNLSLSRLAREPLTHFVLITAVAMAVELYAQEPEQNVIGIPTSLLETYAAEYEDSHGETPPADEIALHKAQAIREAILYREGLRNGLESEDEVIRARVVDKMELLLESSAPGNAPAEAELRNFLAANSSRYLTPARYTYDISQPITDAAPAVAARLNQQNTPDLPEATRRFNGKTAPIIKALHGESLYDGLQAHVDGGWFALQGRQGPVVARVVDYQAPELPPFKALESALRKDWEAEQLALFVEEQIAALQQRYRVEWRD